MPHNDVVALSMETISNEEIQLISSGMPARNMADGIIRIVVISPKEDQVMVWGPDEFRYVTGQNLTRQLVQECYLEIDSFTEVKKHTLKFIPQLLREMRQRCIYY